MSEGKRGGNWRRFLRSPEAGSWAEIWGAGESGGAGSISESHDGIQKRILS